MEVWFGFANGQILSMFDRVNCLPCDCGRVYHFTFFFFYFSHLIAPDKALFFQMKSIDVFLISPQKHVVVTETLLLSTYNIHI